MGLTLCAPHKLKADINLEYFITIYHMHQFQCRICVVSLGLRLFALQGHYSCAGNEAAQHEQYNGANRFGRHVVQSV